MTFTLQRGNPIPDGIEGTITDGSLNLVTLERTWAGSPKIPAGTYQCQRGTFTLEGGVPTVYWQVMDVPNHTDCLLHVANYVSDLNGCIGLGDKDGPDMICDSQKSFNEFMAYTTAEDVITLIVLDIL